MKDRRSGTDRRDWGKRVIIRERIKHNSRLTERELSIETGISKDMIMRIKSEIGGGD